MTISYEQIAQRAFEIWDREGRPPGKDKEHWFRAEEELRKETTKKSKGRKTAARDAAALKTPRGENL